MRALEQIRVKLVVKACFESQELVLIDQVAFIIKVIFARTANGMLLKRKIQFYKLPINC